MVTLRARDLTGGAAGKAGAHSLHSSSALIAAAAPPTQETVSGSVSWRIYARCHDHLWSSVDVPVGAHVPAEALGRTQGRPDGRRRRGAE